MLTILFDHVFFLFYFIDLYFLIPAVITQIVNPIVGHEILIEVPIKKVKSEMETHPVIIEITISECSI